MVDFNIVASRIIYVTYFFIIFCSDTTTAATTESNFDFAATTPNFIYDFAREPTTTILNLTENVINFISNNISFYEELEQENTINIILMELEKKLTSSIKVNKITGFAQAITSEVSSRVDDIRITSNVGIALIDNKTDNDIIPIHYEANETLFINKMTKAAIRLPNTLIDIQKQSKNTYLATTVINKTDLTRTEVDIFIPIIISASFGGESIKNLQEDVKIWFQRNVSKYPSPGICVSWDHSGRNGLGDWTTCGCEFEKSVNTADNDIVIDKCRCNHLTYFAQLFIDQTKYYKIDQINYKILTTITLFGSFLSLVGIIGIILTASCLKYWIENPGHQLQLQIALNYAILLVLFLLISYIPENTISNLTRLMLGVFLHYSVLSNIVWMFIAAILQYFRLVKVFYKQTSGMIMTIVIFGCILPAIPPFILLILSNFTECHLYNNYRKFYLPKGGSFQLSLILPLAIVMIANLIVFILIAYNLLKKGNIRQHINYSKAIVKFKKLIFLFLLFGLGWIFALFQQLVNNNLLLVCSYLFSIIVAIQGVIYFTFFIYMDRSLKKSWKLQQLTEFIKPNNKTSESKRNEDSPISTEKYISNSNEPRP